MRQKKRKYTLSVIVHWYFFLANAGLHSLKGEQVVTMDKIDTIIKSY